MTLSQLLSLRSGGRWLAYVSNSSGENEVYLVPFQTPGEAFPVSNTGGRYPRWNPRGGELFYAGGPPLGTDPNSHRELFSVSVNADGTPGRPERLFDAVDLGFRLTYRGSRGYDIGTDGERIIVQAIGLEGTPTISIMDTHAWLARALSR